MVDYRINLAKTVVSTPEQRRKFYNGMILYLALCAAGLVYVAYLASANMLDARRANKERQSTIEAVSAATYVGKSFFKNPDQAYEELLLYAADLELLTSAFSQRTHFLPVLSQLFTDFPEDVRVEALEASAENNSINYALVGPLESVKKQQSSWKQNDELKGLVSSIKQVKSKQYDEVGDQALYLFQFECILKK